MRGLGCGHEIPRGELMTPAFFSGWSPTSASHRRFCLLLCVAWAFSLGCSTYKHTPTFLFDAGPRTVHKLDKVVAGVEVQIVKVEVQGIAPMSVNSIMYLKCEAIHGEVPGHPALRLFWIRVEGWCQVGGLCRVGNKLLLGFDRDGQELVAVMEFEAEAEKFRRSHPWLETTNSIWTLPLNSPGPHW
jgi:hypothetical protein